MLRSIKELRGYKLLAKDGDIGKVHEFYFDDRAWVIRYLVADTGNWLINRRVLISPTVLDNPDWEEHAIPVSLTKEQIENSPDIAEDRPVSLQQEMKLMNYYRWPNYWESVGAHMPETALIMTRLNDEKNEDKARQDEEGNPHLRSSREVIGYYIRALDGEIGHVEDFIVEDESWVIRYVVVDTKNWLPWGKNVIISPSWIERVDWADERVIVDLKKDIIEKSPDFDASKPVNREYEVRLYDYYGRPVYWKE